MNTSEWYPQETPLQDILQTIHDSIDTCNIAAHKNVIHRLNSFTRAPDYIAYLAYILSSMPQEEDMTRAIAGYILKNNATLVHCAPPEVTDFMKSAVLTALSSPSSMIRNAAVQSIVSLLGVLEPINWPESLQQLVHMLDAPNPDQQEAAFSVLERACEDYPRKLDVKINGVMPLEFMIPKFIMLSEHQHSSMRAHAIACLSPFLPIGCLSLLTHIDTFIACLFRRAEDENPAVRQRVCHALLLLLESRPDKLMPAMNNVTEYMLYSMKDENESVALEACEFWLRFVEDIDRTRHMLAMLATVAPALLDRMAYSKENLLWLTGDEKDEAVPDMDSDIKPRHYGGKLRGLECEVDGDDASGSERRAVAYDAEDDEGKDDDYDELDDEDSLAEEVTTEWNPRKCAAATLDVLAVRFGPELMNVLQEPLQAKLRSPDWVQRECGILALGAIAEGCIDAIEPYLPDLVTYLVRSALNDPQPLVRSITCWTLGRYASWCTAQPMSEEHKRNFFVPTMEGLLRMVLDSNKRVQEAGCSAFATLEECAGPALAPYLEPVLRTLVLAFDKYQRKNMLNLYDAVGTLADAVGMALQNPTYVEIIAPTLLKCWSKLKDNDDDLTPLLNCLASVTIAFGPTFHLYAGPVFQQCIAIVHRALLRHQTYQQNFEMDKVDDSLLVVALELLSGLTQGLGMTLEPYVAHSQPNLLSLLNMCLKHPRVAVRNSGYVLVGYMAMNCLPALEPVMAGVMGELIVKLDHEQESGSFSACSNAAWAVGEIALQYSRTTDNQEFQQWVDPLIRRLIPILLHPNAPRSLRESAAVSVGRIGLVHPTLVAPYLPKFAQAWCHAVCDLHDRNEDKDSAHRGFCMLVQTNPAGVANSLLWFCNAIVRCNQPSPELNSMFQTLLNSLKQHNTVSWAAQVATFPPAIQEGLASRYGV